jgi:hypothetical protein
VSATTHRTTARHFEPALTPPDGEQPDPEDTFHWLYRKEPAAEAAAPVPPTVDPPGGPPVTMSGSGGVPGSGPLALVGLRPTDPSEPRRPRHRVLWLSVLLVLVLAGAGVVVALWYGSAAGDSTSPTPASSAGTTDPQAGPSVTGPDPTSTSRAGADPPYKGALVPVRVSRASADCQARPSTDAGGRPVSYEPALVSDGDPGTAWRCPGPATGRSIVFRFAEGTRIAQVGLSNGYTKFDPKTGEHRYGEYRRVSEVTWTFPSGTTYRQRLRDEVEAVQTLRIPVEEADRVTVTVTRSTAPGEDARNRDAVLVSEVTFAGPVG